jgi:hypothetical protein
VCLSGAAGVVAAIAGYRFVRAERESGAAIRQAMAAQSAYFKARDPHCDACALDVGSEPEP